MPLSAEGADQARRLGGRLPLDGLTAVWCSPLTRATETASLAGLTVERFDPDLVEWDYGAAEGRTTDEIRLERPGWDIWNDGVAELGGGGETVNQVGVRADRVIERARTASGIVVLVAHAHLLRILAARWLGLSADGGRSLTLDAAGWGLLGWERETPVIERWNP